MNGNPPDDSDSDREFAYGRSWQEYLARHAASDEPDDEPAEPEDETPEDEEEAASEEAEPAEDGPTPERRESASEPSEATGEPESEPSEPPESEPESEPSEPEHPDETPREPAARRPAEPEEEPAASPVVIPPEEEQFEGASRRRRRLVAGAAAALAVVLAALFVPDLLPVGGGSEAPQEAGETPASEAGPTADAGDFGGAIATDSGGQGAGQPPAAGQIALFSSRAEALADALENFGVRLRDFELNRIGCEGLARGMREVRATYSGVADVYDTVQSRLEASSVDRYQRLSAEVGDAERSFEGTGCSASP